MRFDKERYQRLRQEYHGSLEGRRLQGSRARTEFDPEDLALLEQLRARTRLYPLLYSVPTVGVFYALMHFGNFQLLRNPLRTATAFDATVSRRVRQIYFFSFAAVTMPLIHCRFIFQYSIAKSAVYQRYQHLVDQFVVLRDEMVFESLIKHEEQL